jgi:hypothetical protein
MVGRRVRGALSGQKWLADRELWRRRLLDLLEDLTAQPDLRRPDVGVQMLDAPRPRAGSGRSAAHKVLEVALIPGLELQLIGLDDHRVV